MRLFIAVNFPKEIKNELESNAGYIKSHVEKGNFSRRENYHITLAFLGEIEPKRVTDIKRIMERTDFGSFTLTLGKFGVFRRSGGDIVWRSIEKSDPLIRLRDTLVRSLAENGFGIDENAFRPHITLSRETFGAMPSAFPANVPVSFEVKSYELMRSERVNGVLTYTPLYSREAKKG